MSNDDKKTETPEPLIRVSSSMREGPVIQTRDGYYRVLHARDWGKIVVPSNNPEGMVLTEYELMGIQLNSDFPKIPASLWAPYIELCFFMCPEGKRMSAKFHESQLEVQVCLLRDAETRTKWKIVVPKQVVSGVSVKAELAENIDIVTGEKYTQFPPPGWVHAGSSHSHNTMEAFFSGVDDKSELTVPGLHIVVGAIDHEKGTYHNEASIVLKKTRKMVHLDQVVEIDLEQIDFHPDVIDYIDTVVSANRKKYKEIAKEDEDEQKNKNKAKNELVIDSRSSKGFNFCDDDDDKVPSFLYGLDETNSDLFDENSYYPFDDDMEAIVNHSIDSGYSFNDILASAFRARRKRSKALKDENENENDTPYSKWTKDNASEMD